MKETLKATIIKDYLSRFPSTPNRTLCNAIYKENAEVFNNAEHVRSVIRYYTGNSGGKNRNKRKVVEGEEFFSDDKSLSPFDSIPEGIKSFDDSSPFTLDGNRVLVLADVHIPYHDKDSLKIALSYGVNFGCDTILLLGDFMDFYSISRWEKDPRRRDFQYELDVYTDVMDSIRDVYKDQKIVYLIGNHELRFDRYLKVKAPELYGVNYVNFETFFDSEKYNIEIVRNNRVVKIGGLNCIHGHELNICRGVVPARSLYLKGKQNAIMGHLHTTTDFSTKRLTGDVVSCWSIGCLCDMKPEYAPFNEWNHGFAIVERLDEKNFRVNNFKIIKGMVF